MKKISIIVVLVLMVFLSGCGINYNSIERSFEKAGYEYSESGSYVALLVTELESDEMDVEVYSFTNGTDATAVVINFKNEEDINSAFLSNPFLAGYTDDGYEISDLTRDHYVVLPLALSDADAEEIIDVFQGRK